MEDAAWWTYDDFADLVGDRFELDLPDGTHVPVTLVDATAGGRTGGAGPDGAPRLQFTLVFRGPVRPVLAQGTRTLRHVGLGDVALFLVPLGAADDGVRYEAAFA